SLRLAARADEETGGLDEIAVGPHLIEDALGDDDRELRLERHRQLDEIERIGGQVVTQRALGDQLLDAYAKTVSDQASNVRFHEFLHAPPPRDDRGDAPRRTPSCASRLIAHRFQFPGRVRASHTSSTTSGIPKP